MLQLITKNQSEILKFQLQPEQISFDMILENMYLIEKIVQVINYIHDNKLKLMLFCPVYLRA